MLKDICKNQIVYKAKFYDLRELVTFKIIQSNSFLLIASFSYCNSVNNKILNKSPSLIALQSKQTK